MGIGNRQGVQSLVRAAAIPLDLATYQLNSHCKRGRASGNQLRPLLNNSPPESRMHTPLPGGPGEAPGASSHRQAPSAKSTPVSCS